MKRIAIRVARTESRVCARQMSTASPFAPKAAENSVSFNWEDPFLMDGQLTEEERMVRDSARAYCDQELMPRVTLEHRNETCDTGKMMREMGSLGLLGPTLPEKYGCAGLSYVSYGLIARELERVDSAYRSSASVQVRGSPLRGARRHRAALGGTAPRVAPFSPAAPSLPRSPRS